MTTNKELRELAEKAKSGSWFESGDLRYEDARSGYMHGLHHDEDGFIAAASPDRVLELLDENEALQDEYGLLRAAIRRLCNIYVVDDYYEGQLREESLDAAVSQAIDAALAPYRKGGDVL